jgi:endonuclease/exonuclease/phosphatase family metal-dependent hydrolase
VKRFLVALLCFTSLPAFSAEIRVLTFNIRYNNPMDGANAWPFRQEAVAKLIREHADVAGLQEVKPEQRAWLVEHLPEFGLIGIGRGLNDTDESVPVVYRKERFEILSSGTFWLSETPEQPASTSWGNKLPRVCTWARLRDRRDERALWFYNVHLDHQSGVAREKGLALVADRIGARQEKDPALLVGDLNSSVGDAPLATLALKTEPVLRSTYEIMDVPAEGTFHGFTGKTGTRAIDYIFVEKDRWKVVGGKVLKTTYPAPDGVDRFVSDHFPVEASVEMLLEGGKK